MRIEIAVSTVGVSLLPFASAVADPWTDPVRSDDLELHDARICGEQLIVDVGVPPVSIQGVRVGPSWAPEKKVLGPAGWLAGPARLSFATDGGFGARTQMPCIPLEGYGPDTPERRCPGPAYMTKVHLPPPAEPETFLGVEAHHVNPLRGWLTMEMGGRIRRSRTYTLGVTLAYWRDEPGATANGELDLVLAERGWQVRFRRQRMSTGTTCWVAEVEGEGRLHPLLRSAPPSEE